MLNEKKSRFLSGKSIIIFFASLLILAGPISSQWNQTTGTPDGAGITDMIVTSNGTVFVTCASFNYPNGQMGGIRRSSTGGQFWQNVVSCYTARTLYQGNGGVIFASYWDYPIDNESLYRSTNDGLIWSPLHNIGTNDNIFSITGKNNNNTLFIGTRNGVKRSTNGGTGWTLLSGMPANSWVYALDISFNGTYIAAGTSKGLFVSSNDGANWTAVSNITQNDTIRTVKFVHYTTDAPGDRLYSGESDGTVRESDPDQSIILGVVLVVLIGAAQVVEADEKVITVGSTRVGADNLIDNGFASSTDRGATWSQYNSGLPQSPNVSSLTYQVQGNNIKYYAGLFENTNGGAKVFTMTSPIGIQQISSEVPNGFSLSQNYPNPFNPTTNIEFSIPKSSFVKLVVYDMLGREVETLVSKDLKAGTYKADWIASKYTCSVYFYKLITEGYTETKKMILVK